MRKLTATLCLTIAVLLGSAVGSESSSETTYLTGEQIRLLVSENKMQTYYRTTAEVNFKKDGELIAYSGTNLEGNFGTWSLSQNQICIQFDDTGDNLDKRENCFFSQFRAKRWKPSIRIVATRKHGTFTKYPMLSLCHLQKLRMNKRN